MHHMCAMLWLSQVDKAFGFDTAVEEAQRALMAAKVEASSAYRGIGLVKLAGRQSGFIAIKVGRQKQAMRTRRRQRWHS